MKEQNQYPGTPMPTMLTKITWLGLATAVGLMLTLTVVIAQSPNFDTSYKTGPQYARTNDVITYSIVTINTGDVMVDDVTLSDTLPSGVIFVLGSCMYDYGGYQPVPCGPPNAMWKRVFYPGTRITTTFAATVTVVATGTMHVPLINRAYVSWDGGQQAIAPFTTTVVAAIPEFDLYGPIPSDADVGQVITYTIVAMNNGDSVTDVRLYNRLPNGVAFVPNSCTNTPPPGSLSLDLPCNDLVPGQEQLVWEQDMPQDNIIITTFEVTVTAPADSVQLPLRNCAYLRWGVIQKELCRTSLANPMARLYMPQVSCKIDRDTYEPNGTPEQAFGPLASGEAYLSFIWDGDDLDDYYYIVPTSTVDVHIELTNIPEGSDFDLYVYRYDNGYEQVAISNLGGNLDESVIFTPTPNEKYYIRVHIPLEVITVGYNADQPYHLEATYQ